jgi:hypothetical protein
MWATKKSILKKLWERNILKICGKKKHIFFMKKSQSRRFQPTLKA